MEIYIYSLISALLVFMVDYGFGKPGSDNPNTRSLLAFWPFFLAKQALKKAGAWEHLNKQYHDQIQMAQNGVQLAEIKHSFRDIVLKQAKQVLTWQWATGICPMCTHFWVNIIFVGLVNIFFLKVNLIIFILQLLLSHTLIRLLSKYL